MLVSAFVLFVCIRLMHLFCIYCKYITISLSFDRSQTASGFHSLVDDFLLLILLTQVYIFARLSSICILLLSCFTCLVFCLVFAFVYCFASALVCYAFHRTVRSFVFCVWLWQFTVCLCVCYLLVSCLLIVFAFCFYLFFLFDVCLFLFSISFTFLLYLILKVLALPIILACWCSWYRCSCWSWLRSLVSVRPALVVIVDVLAACALCSNHCCDWLFHFFC